MENKRIKNKEAIIIIVLVILLVLVVGGIFVYQYIKNKENTNVENNKQEENIVYREEKNTLEKEELKSEDEQDTEKEQEEIQKEDNYEDNNQQENIQDKINEEDELDEIKYPTTMGAIFEYSIDDLNQNVVNKTSDVTYLELRTSNPYKISKDRKSITIGETILIFEKEIYHACVYPLEQGGTDLWVVLFRDGTVKYSKDYGETIKNGETHIVDIFPVSYKRSINDEIHKYLGGGTIIMANEYGGLIDLRMYPIQN